MEYELFFIVLEKQMFFDFPIIYQSLNYLPGQHKKNKKIWKKTHFQSDKGREFYNY